jgi:hypothetical protein
MVWYFCKKAKGSDTLRVYAKYLINKDINTKKIFGMKVDIS